MLAQGCHCGARRLETGSDKTGGAAPIVPAVETPEWFGADLTDFRFTAGVAAAHAASPRSLGRFCDRCGAQLVDAAPSASISLDDADGRLKA